MDRRLVLRWVGGGALVGLAGCTGTESLTRERSTTATSTTRPTHPSTQPTSRTPTLQLENRTVAVTQRVESGQTGLSRVLKVGDGGQLEYVLTCPDGTTKTASATLPAETWRAFKRLVLQADVGTFASEYTCRGDCPQDLPPTHLTVEIDEETTDVLVESAANPPRAVTIILDELDSFKSYFTRPSCQA